MYNVDKIRENHSKRQKYLGLRVFVLFLLVLFGVGSIYSSNVDNTIFFNTLILFFAPIFLDYLYGMSTYSKRTDTFRLIGLCVSGFFLFVCMIGLMGKVVIVRNDYGIVSELIFFVNLLPLLKICSYAIIANAFCDYIFTFNKREMHYYRVFDEIEKEIESRFEEIQQNNSLEKRTEKAKTELLGHLKTAQGAQGGGK